MNIHKTIRVLHCPDIVGGNAQSLARAERELGLDSWSIAFRQTIFSYLYDEILLGPAYGYPAYAYAMWSLFWRGFWGYDIIHYNFGQTIFPVFNFQNTKGGFFWPVLRYLAKLFGMFDLRLFHMVGKVMAVTFQGDDARQGDFSEKHFEISISKFVEPGYYTLEQDENKRKTIAMFDRFADLIYYLNPDLGHVLPSRARFLPYAHIDLRDWMMSPPTHNSRLLIVHAPSHRGVKGTATILAVIDRLKKDGMDFDFKVVENLPNKKAREIYEQADLLIDQLYAGWYGGLALELMALGKPVISYIRRSDLKFIPAKMRDELPIIDANADTLYDVLKFWINDRAGLHKRGIQSRAYVENWHDPLVIAAQLKDEYIQALSVKRSH